MVAEKKSPGDVVLVTLTRILADADLPFTLRIVPFGSEESWLHGGRFYVQSLSDEELENTKAMLNFDVLGSGTGVSVRTSPSLLRLLERRPASTSLRPKA